MTNNNQFEFRSKFKKILNDSNEAVIIAAFEKFMDLQPDIARKYLWGLTYSKARTSVVLNELGIFNDVIPEDKIQVFRNELRSEYEKRNSDFLKADIPDLAREAYDSLVKQAGNDTILANIVCYHCYKVVYGSSEIRNRVFFLLKSDNEKFYFGAFRLMGFGYDEAEYLKPYHFLIHALIEKLYAQEKKPDFDPEFFNGIEEEWYENEDDEMEQEDETEESNHGGIVLKKVCPSAEECFEEDIHSEPETEISDVSEIAEETVYVAQETEGEEEEAQTDSEYKALVPSAVLNDKAAFRGFVKNSEDLNTLVEIGKIGYDLNEVMAKKELISNLVNASDEFAEIYKTMEVAEQNLNDAISKMLKA